MNYNHVVINADTDSLTICNSSQTFWSKEERQKFLDELNNILPPLIKFEDDGYFSHVLVIKSKNYVLKDYDTGKVKTKGSSIRDNKKEPILKQFMEEVINSILEYGIDYKNLELIYHKYIKEAMNVTDISKWCSKKSISQPILACKGWETKSKEQLKEEGIRTNEIQIWEAIKDLEDKQDGNKVYVYPAILEYTKTETQLKNGKIKIKEEIKTGLKLRENWSNDQDKYKLVERVYSTLIIFEKLLDMNLFIDYTLKKNRELLDSNFSN